MVKRYDEGENCCGFVLIILSVIAFGFALGMNIAGYVRFGSSDECGSTLWVNIITTLIIILLPVLQFCNFNKQNSLLTTGLVCLYISYLAFISQYSYCSNSDPGICIFIQLSQEFHWVLSSLMLPFLRSFSSSLCMDPSWEDPVRLKFLRKTT